jgi:hypothetical protein
LDEGTRDWTEEEQELAVEDAMETVERMQEYIEAGKRELADDLINEIFRYDQDWNVFVYKKVANKVKPVSTMTSKKFKVQRN